MITGVEDEGDIMTEERKGICTWATLMATHAYTRDPESHLGNDIDLQQWDTSIGHYGLGARNIRGDSLVTFAESHQLKIMNT